MESSHTKHSRGARQNKVELRLAFERLDQLRDARGWAQIATPTTLLASVTSLSDEIRSSSNGRLPESAGHLAAEMILVGMQIAQLADADLAASIEDELRKREEAASAVKGT